VLGGRLTAKIGMISRLRSGCECSGQEKQKLRPAKQQ
jgi:hypothetical protein